MLNILNIFGAGRSIRRRRELYTLLERLGKVNISLDAFLGRGYAGKYLVYISVVYTESQKVQEKKSSLGLEREIRLDLGLDQDLGLERDLDGSVLVESVLPTKEEADTKIIHTVTLLVDEDSLDFVCAAGFVHGMSWAALERSGMRKLEKEIKGEFKDIMLDSKEYYIQTTIST